MTGNRTPNYNNRQLQNWKTLDIQEYNNQLWLILYSTGSFTWWPCIWKAPLSVVLCLVPTYISVAYVVPFYSIMDTMLKISPGRQLDVMYAEVDHVTR